MNNKKNMIMLQNLNLERQYLIYFQQIIRIQMQQTIRKQFSETPISKAIHSQFVSKILQEGQKNTQLGQTFHQINYILCLSQSETNPHRYIYSDYIKSQILNQQNNFIRKIQALHKLERTNYELQMMKQQCKLKQQQQEQKAKTFNTQQSTIEEDIELLEHQNAKSKQQLEKHSKQLYQEPQQIKYEMEQMKSRQLGQILLKYECVGRTFPKNKTQALMLLNRLDNIIQELQIKQMEHM